MVVSIVVILQVLPSHLRDVPRVAAVGISGDRAREEGLFKVEHGIRLDGVSALHLGIDRAGQGKRRLLVSHGVAPGFLQEDALILHQHGVKDAVRVVVGILEQLILRQRGQGIGGHDVGGHGVDKGIVGLVH